MIFSISLRAGIASLALLLTTATAFAAAADYEFQPLKVDVKNGTGSELAVRLVHKPSGKPVSGAVLFRTRLDMAPDNMADMTATLVVIPAIYAVVKGWRMPATVPNGGVLNALAQGPAR